MKLPYLRHVVLTPDDGTLLMGTCRMGTASASAAHLKALFMRPNMILPDDGKVTMGWVFRTPRGFVAIRDYWWNPPGTWSLAAPNRKALLWFKGYLRQAGITVGE